MTNLTINKMRLDDLIDGSVKIIGVQEEQGQINTGVYIDHILLPYKSTAKY